jgi:hypothetical protein
MKDNIKSWKESLSPSKDLFAAKFLFKRLITYRNVIINRSTNILKAKAEVYRQLIRYTQEVIKVIKELEEDLIKEKAEVYFPSDNEKLYCEEGQIHITELKTKKDWVRAYEQENSNE